MKNLSWKRIAVLFVMLSVIYSAAFLHGHSVSPAECTQVIVSVPMANSERFVEEMANSKQAAEMVVRDIGSAVFSYYHEHAARLETRVRLAERAGDFLVFDLEDAREVGMDGLYGDLQTLPGVENIMVSPWKIHLEKTQAFTWKEVEPLLAEIGKRHKIL